MIDEDTQSIHESLGNIRLELPESVVSLKRFDACRRYLETKTQRPFDGELAVEEVAVLENLRPRPRFEIVIDAGDLGLPDMDGIDVIRALRRWTMLPIIILSARSAEQHKIEALDAGADDYLTKPFGLGELLARIRVALRHSALNPQSGDSEVFTTGGLRVDLQKRMVSVNSHPVHLTPIQYRLLSVLVKHAGKVLTHRQILNEVWGPSYLDNTHYLRIYMSQLRQKLEADPAQPQYLLTESGVGYRLQG